MSTANLADAARIHATQTLLAKYTSHLPPRPPPSTDTFHSRTLSGSVVLVTGTTGSLGCHLLETLVCASSVSRIYAVNRRDRGSRKLRERQAEALRERGIDEDTLASKKVVLVEADLTKSHFGLPEEEYREMHESVTHVLHNAWRVDLISPLWIFEPNIAGLRGLIDFCLTSPHPTAPRLVFTSSIWIVGRAPRDQPVLEDPIPVSWPLGAGYTEAKWVAEELVYAATRVTSLDGLVVRVGQLTGGKAGAWATSEWYPCMVQSAAKNGVGCFPDDNRVHSCCTPPTWNGIADSDNVAQLMDILPFELAASALLDFLHVPKDVLDRAAPTRTVHLVHPRPVPWHDVAEHVACELGARLVSYSEWLRDVELFAVFKADCSVRKARRLRAQALLPFFQDMNRTMLAGARAMGFPAWDGPRGVAASPTLADPNLEQLSVEDVKRWIGYWRRIGFIQDEQAHEGIQERARL
ncbi:NAD(P)-binding protein [Daedalea quercina L-15889]|uniref:NAD(P)-binding protein n=1 Tax=Daedalea quercina L-15889 TaxID=1314783 RepID=A0A165KN25_9APHY|nr:NAD(P)-binding protein [Daedalea quercina L-15889]